MEKAKIRPLATPKPLNRSSQKLAGVITFWTAPGMQNFVAIGSGVSVTPITHSHATVRECFKGDEASQWKRPKFDPSPHQNPLTDLHKNWQA